VFYCKSFPPRAEAERFGEMFPTVMEVVRDLKKKLTVPEFGAGHRGGSRGWR
jgi:hypothetical protein